eukprot:scaffold8271_cov149-Skeletonema_marinoi.AAC.5
MAAEEEYYVYTGGVVPLDVTRVRIDKSISVIPALAFRGHPNIEEVHCHGGEKKVEEFAFNNCPSLRRVIMPGVEVVEQLAFRYCEALADVECGELEIIGEYAFSYCESLRSINLLSAKIVQLGAFIQCTALTNVKFGKELERLNWGAFLGCRSLEQITIPLKDGMISDNAFRGCENLKHVDLVEGAILHETIDALLLEEWKKGMRWNIDVISQILSTTPAGGIGAGVGGKAVAIRAWITNNVLLNIIHYKAQHHRHLKEHANTLELALWKKRLSEINAHEGDDEGRAESRVKCGADIVMKNVLPFLELPPYTFGGED